MYRLPFLFFLLQPIASRTWAAATLDCDSVKIQSKQTLPLCDGDSTDLSILSKNKNLSYRWFRDGVDLNINSLTLKAVKKSGLYKVIVTNNTTPCTTQDSLKLMVLPRPAATLIASGPTNICTGEPLKLSTTKQTNYDYLWLLNDIPLVAAIGSEWQPQKTGTYAVIVTDTSTKCSTKSDKKIVVLRPVPIVTLDSIAPVCNNDFQTIALKGSPAGGIYSGRGVVEDKFPVFGLPSANYVVTYTFTNAEGCSNRAIRTVVVAPPPRIQVPFQLVILKGESIEIKTSIPPKSTVIWSPSLGLSDTKSTTPTANPQTTTTYQMEVTTPEGCRFAVNTKIVVVDLTIPNGFTPNGDGINDKWEIDGIGTYPNSVVEVYNRWGNVVFRSISDNAQWNGDALPLGIYYYSIYLREIEYKVSGEVLIIR